LKDDKNEHQIVVDGVPSATLVTAKSSDRYELVRGLTPGEHRVEVYRRTEALFGPTTFLGLEVENGQLLANGTTPKRRIELIGDSISCGYGNLGKSSNCSFSAETENHYESYGAILARKFDAELSTVAWSGRGVVKNYDGGGGETMVALYDRVLPEEMDSVWRPINDNQAVIVNLGTNDFSTEPDPSGHEFVSAYGKLLDKIRRNNPSAFVVCTVGPMLGGDDLEKAESYVAQAVEQRKNMGDMRIMAYRMTTPNQVPGCDYHPSVETHQFMASELSNVLSKVLGW
jgi:lysophospholipase L1-like esterase